MSTQPARVWLSLARGLALLQSSCQRPSFLALTLAMSIVSTIRFSRTDAIRRPPVVTTTTSCGSGFTSLHGTFRDRYAAHGDGHAVCTAVSNNQQSRGFGVGAPPPSR